MNAQIEAYKNYLNSFYGTYNHPDGTSFKKPNPNIGYGQLLKTIATAPKNVLVSRIAINAYLNKPTYPTTKSVHGVDNYNRLVRAKLIEKKNNFYQLTKLGEKYVAEMHLI